MIFEDPDEQINPIGKARLIKKLIDFRGLEEWKVQFINVENISNESYPYNVVVLLKNEDDETASNKNDERAEDSECHSWPDYID